MNNNDHLFINENTGVSVLADRVPDSRSVPVLEVVAVCDLCEGDILKEIRGSLAGSVVRLLHQCSQGGNVCDVEILPYNHDLLFPHCSSSDICDASLDFARTCDCMRAYLCLGVGK